MARQVLPIIGAVVGAFIPGVGPAIGWAVGSMIGNAVDPLVVKGPSIGDIAQQTSQEGVPRPIIFARSPPIAGNIIATSEPIIIRRKESQGKGGPKVKTESVYRTYAIGVCEGPISAFVRVWRNGILVYDAGAGVTSDNAKFLEAARFFLGSWSQEPSPDLETIFGVGTTAAHRGTAYMVMADEDLTDLRGSIPQWLFQIERCAISLEAVNDECDAVITWSAFDGADSYRLHRVHNDVDEVINDGDVQEFIDTDVEPEEVYQYFVRPVVHGVEVTQSNSVTIVGEDCVPDGTFMVAAKGTSFNGLQRRGAVDTDPSDRFGSISPMEYYIAGPGNPPIYIQDIYFSNELGGGGGMFMRATTHRSNIGNAPGSFFSFSYLDEGGVIRTFYTGDAFLTSTQGNGYGGSASYWIWSMPSSGGVPIESARFVEGNTYEITFNPPNIPP